MFGKPRQPEPHAAAAAPSQPAAERARIVGGGLVQVVVMRTAPMAFCLFLNDTYVDQSDVESLFVAITGPTSDQAEGQIQATLAHRVKQVDGQSAMARQELFPCTIEVVAAGRRLVVSAARADSLDGLWMDLGLRPDGESNRVEGAQALELLLDDTILRASLTWHDGRQEDIFPLTADG
jgi:hypothetical protein